MDLIRRALEFLGPGDSRERRLAEEAFRERHPSLATSGTSVRAKEADRTVVAVFFDDPKLPSRPSPYKLFAVRHESASVEEIPCDPSSPYWIRGRK